ncbi:MAG: hypothetical protein NTX36_16125 [Proteobacteria bacterium]|nr:hypothetical protein [Pseudomonadota bacterium]
MRTRYMKLFAVLSIFVFVLSSCASMLPSPDQITSEEDLIAARNKCFAMYTVGGALGGAILGGLISGDWKGAGFGAAAGGAIGFAYAWGKCLSLYSTLKSQPVAGYAETVQKTNYNSSQGNIVKIEDFSINPANVLQGGSAGLSGSYYVMAPDGTKEIKVTETRTVKYFDPKKNEFVELGSVDQEITAAPGSRKADGKFDVPKDVPEGRYVIAFKVSAAGKEDTVEKEMLVQKAAASNATANIEIAGLTATMW